MIRRHHHALPAGYRLHWYELETVLGQGGFGITYLAHDVNLGAKVAIKEFLPSELATRTADSQVHPLSDGHVDTFGWGLSRFLNEAQTLARFRHPNIVRVLAVFEANQTAYMVMEYERGVALGEALEFRRIECDQRTLLDIALPLLDGLDQVHAAGFIHRDIKPANIMLREDGSPVLIDFGSARQALGRETRTLTALVSPGYAPFEQYNASAENDQQGPWTDIYSLAATLYRAVSGRPPPDAMARVGPAMQGNDIYEPLAGRGDDRYQPHFLAAIDQALQLLPERRPQTAHEWRDLLSGAVAVGIPDGDAVTALRRPVEETVPAGAGDGQTAASAAGASITTRAATPRVTPGETPPRRWLPAMVVVALLAAGTVAWFGRGWLSGDAPPATALIRAPVAASGVDADADVRAAEQQRQRAAEESARIAEQERQRAAEESARIAEQERQRAAEDAARIAEQERQRAAEEAARVAEQERQRAAEEAARIAEQERQRAAEEAARAAEHIRSLLAEADADIDALRLSSPPGNNAVERLRAVLVEQPAHPDALAALARVVDRYVALADDALGRGDLERAAAMLDRAEATTPSTSAVDQARVRLQQAGDAAAAAAAARDEAARVAASAAANPRKVAVLSCRVSGGVASYAAMSAMSADLTRTVTTHADTRLLWNSNELAASARPIDESAVWPEADGGSTPQHSALAAAARAAGADLLVLCGLHFLGRPDARVEVFLFDATRGTVNRAVATDPAAAGDLLESLLAAPATVPAATPAMVVDERTDTTADTGAAASASAVGGRRLAVLGAWCAPCGTEAPDDIRNYLEGTRQALAGSPTVTVHSAPWRDAPAPPLADEYSRTRFFSGVTSSLAEPDTQALSALARGAGADAVLVGMMVYRGFPPYPINVFLVDAHDARLFREQVSVDDSGKAVAAVLRAWLAGR